MGITLGITFCICNDKKAIIFVYPSVVIRIIQKGIDLRGVPLFYDLKGLKVGNLTVVP